jgi:hypothetical protein
MRSLFPMLIAIAAGACAPLPMVVGATAHIGLAPESPVQLNAAHDQQAFEVVEREWLMRNFPGMRADFAGGRYVLSNRVLHVVPVTLRDGRLVQVYFDVTPESK